MRKARQEKPDSEAKRFECSWAPGMLRRAIYIDFEGFMDKAPSLVGVAVNSKFFQVVLDDGLRLAAAAKKIPVRPGDELVKALFERAMRENRRIVAFSPCEKRICRNYYQLDLSPVYVDAGRIRRPSTSPGGRRWSFSRRGSRSRIDSKRRMGR